MSSEYLIDHFDGSIVGKEPITVPAGYFNNTSTSLKLYGHGYKNYGEGLLENMVHLLENFCSDSRMPENPTEGQLWYKRSTKELLLYMGSKAPNNSKNPGWRNIIPKYGWDSNEDGVDASKQYLTIDNFDTLLSQFYIKTDGSNYMKPDANLKLGSTWIKTDNNNNLIIDENIVNNVDYDLYATSKKYVDIRINKEVKDQLLRALPIPNSGSSVTAEIINNELLKLDATTINGSSHLYIRKNSEKDIHRTMEKPLILPKFIDTYNETIHGEYAATMRFVYSLLGSSNGGTIDLSGYIKKSGDTMGGALYLNDESNYTDTNKLRAASRAYVDSKIQNAQPTPISSTIPSAVSFTELPDGTKMIYGRQIGIMKFEQNLVYAGTVNIDVGSNVRGFIDDNYVVTITDHAPKLSKNGVDLSPQDHCWSRNIEYPVGKKFQNYPLLGTFNSYNKNRTYFETSALIWGGTSFWEDSISFDFIAIGRWK